MKPRVRHIPIVISISLIVIGMAVAIAGGATLSKTPETIRRLEANLAKYQKRLGAARRQIAWHKTKLAAARRQEALSLRKVRRIKKHLRVLKHKEIGVTLTYPYRDLAGLEAKLGKRLDMFLWYQSLAEDFDVDLANWLWQRGTKLELAWEPHNPAKGPNDQPEYRLNTITAGIHDADIYRWARQIKTFGRPVLFRPMCEMNGDWTAWSGVANGNKPADFIPAWRHIHRIFKEVGATNAIWVWAPNRHGDEAAAYSTFREYYPGAEYVDYVGINGYNWGTMYNTPSWTSSWQSFSELFGPTYRVAARLTDKPMLIAEMATTEIGGNKAQWIEEAFTDLKRNYPRIKAAVWFNLDKETDWRIDNNQANIATFAKYAF